MALTFDEYEKLAEKLTEEISREDLLAESGQKDSYEIAAIYERYPQMFTLDVVRYLLSDRTDDRKRNLASFAVDGYLANQIKEIAEEVANLEMAATVSYNGRDISYRDAPVQIQNMADREERLKLEKSYVSTLAGFNEKREAVWQGVYSAMREIGFTDYRQMCEELSGLRLDWLKDSCAEILDQTSAGWQQSLGEAAEKLGCQPDELTTGDIAHYFRAREYDDAFPQYRLVPALKDTMLALGFDMDAQPNLILDLEDRPLKSPRAFCSPVKIPDEVWLVIKPHGGQDDYKAILHEAGHAEHYSNTDKALPYALRGLGDSSVTETYAFLMNNLMFNEAWLNKYLGERDWKPFLKFNNFNEVWFLRRYCAKLRYEMQLHSVSFEEAPELYKETLEESLNVRIAKERFLDDVDSGFYVAEYLRAWHLEAQLRRKLESDYGSSWFESAEAGALLLSLFKMGDSLDAWQLAAHLGFDGLDNGPLIDSLTG